jgi:hypothetical protein
MKRPGILSVSILLLLQLSAAGALYAYNASSPVGKSFIASSRKGTETKLIILQPGGIGLVKDLLHSSLHFSPQRNAGSESTAHIDQPATSLPCGKSVRYSFRAFLHLCITQKILFPFHYFW